MARVLSLSLAVPRVLLHRQSGMSLHVVRHPWCPRLRLVVHVRSLQRYNRVRRAVDRRSGTNASGIGMDYSQLRSSTFPATVPQTDSACLAIRLAFHASPTCMSYQAAANGTRLRKKTDAVPELQKQ